MRGKNMKKDNITEERVWGKGWSAERAAKQGKEHSEYMIKKWEDDGYREEQLEKIAKTDRTNNRIATSKSLTKRWEEDKEWAEMMKRSRSIEMKDRWEDDPEGMKKAISEGQLKRFRKKRRVKAIQNSLNKYEQIQEQIQKIVDILGVDNAKKYLSRCDWKYIAQEK